MRKTNKGITLVALVITVIILLILAGVAINALNNTDMIAKSEKATEEYKKKAATEIINLKITNIQISNYVEKQKMPTLQELADDLCDDNEMEYVLTTSKNVASLGKLDRINVGTASSIFTKLKAYPYEFEINSSLQLASIDGVKLATNNDTVTLTNEQYNNLTNRISALETEVSGIKNNMGVTGYTNIFEAKESNNKVGEYELEDYTLTQKEEFNKYFKYESGNLICLKNGWYEFQMSIIARTTSSTASYVETNLIVDDVPYVILMKTPGIWSDAQTYVDSNSKTIYLKAGAKINVKKVITNADFAEYISSKFIINKI